MSWRNQRISGYSVADIAARDALTGLNPGDIVVVADDGTGNEATYIWTGNGWLEIVSNPGAPLHLIGTADEIQFSVTGFAGQTADIVQLISDAGTLSYDNAGDLTVPNDVTATGNITATLDVNAVAGLNIGNATVYSFDILGSTLAISTTAGTGTWWLTNQKFSGNAPAGQGPAIMNVDATSTVPNILAFGLDTNTGLGKHSSPGYDTISIIAGGVEAISFIESAGSVQTVIPYTTYFDFDPLAGTTFRIQNSGGTTLALTAVGSGTMMSMSYAKIYNGACWGLMNEAASATNPTLLPDEGDEDTGIGQQAEDALSLVAGGVEGVRITETAGAVNVLFTDTTEFTDIAVFKDEISIAGTNPNTLWFDQTPGTRSATTSAGFVKYTGDGTIQVVNGSGSPSDANQYFTVPNLLIGGYVWRPAWIEADGLYLDPDNHIRWSNVANANYDAANQNVGLYYTGGGGNTLRVTNGGTGATRGNLEVNNISFGTHSLIGAETVTGYITITDAGGTTRKLAVVS